MHFTNRWDRKSPTGPFLGWAKSADETVEYALRVGQINPGELKITYFAGLIKISPDWRINMEIHPSAVCSNHNSKPE
jgi:hypothetical protein